MRKRILLVSGALAATAAVGYAQFATYTTADITKTTDGKAFVQLFGALHQLYLRPLDDGKLMSGAIKGMIASLNDEFTYYEEPQDNQTSQENLSGEFFGIGIQLTAANTDGTGAKVDTVFKTGSAIQGGVQTGDIFLKIGDKDVTAMSLNDVVRLVRGEKGTKVNITFGRGKSTYAVALERQPVTIISVEQTMLPNNVGYIALNTFFSEKVNEQFSAAVQSMNKKGVKKLILDLRDNGGGLLSSGVFVADQFLQKGPIVSLRDGKGKTTVYDTAKAQPTDYTGQLVLLINKNSASASEIVAGALQDTKRATIVGETSFGKGVAQTPVQLVNGAEVRIVANEWLTPNGRQIQKKGITPDIKVDDNRRPIPLNFTGSGVKAGTKLTLNVSGKPVDVVADKDGKFTYIAPPAPQTRSAEQGVAVVDPAKDAELAAALKQFK
ncbi:S41 family peptidase [Deinococcus detaillensis]|uniref:S41 family peptidase n=1 Tax=Deinococcus detaillensis TaxID=2592048 RepID=UPI001CDB712A|nr:S41 family peptidase [Deinococcus detaillensis]